MYKTSNGKVVYAEDIQCVLDPSKDKGAIYIGNLQASQNLNTLRKYSIKGVLTSANGIFLDHPKHEIPHYLYVPGQDRDNFDLSKYFDKAAHWIHQTLQQTNVLVHCLAGVSRSVSLVIAYLIKFKGMSFDQAFKLLKSRRRIIHPNDGFKKQLRQYEEQIKRAKSFSPQKKQQSPERLTSPSRKNYYPLQRYEFTNAKKTLPQQEMTEASYKKDSYYRKYDLDKKQENLKSSINISRRNKAFSDYNIKDKYNPTRSFVEEDSNASQLDKKIAQIRKKYRDIADNQIQLKRNLPLNRYGYQPYQYKKQNFMDNNDQNTNGIQSRLKKLQSNIETMDTRNGRVPGRIGREYNYKFNYQHLIKPMRKISSYQDY